MDLRVLVYFAGHERTAAKLSELATKNALDLHRVEGIPDNRSLLEFTRGSEE